VHCVEMAAQYLGYFVDPKICCHLILPTLEESLTAGHLRVFAAIISGSERRALSLQLDKIANFLQQPHICQSKKNNYQRQILSCCNSLLTVCKEVKYNLFFVIQLFIRLFFYLTMHFFFNLQDCILVIQALFTIIFTTYAMSMESSVREEADRLLEVLVEINSLKDTEDLFCNHIKPLVASIHDDCASWSVYSAESQIFYACLSRAKIATACNMDLILLILKKTMSKDADPELKLRHFILLSEYFMNNQNLYQYIEDLHKFVSTILEELIIPALIWSAGRAAETIRTAAVCCLCALLQNKIINPDEKTEINKADSSANRENEKPRISITVEQFPSIFDKIVPVLISLVDDKAKKTRLYSMRAICLLISVGQKLSCLNDQHIHSTYPVILKRLDDGCDDIRYIAVEALVDVWNAAFENYDTIVCRSHIDVLYTTMIIHLDDPESHFQEIILSNDQIFTTSLQHLFIFSQNGFNI